MISLHTNRQNNRQGFTVIELLVSIAIFGILSVVVIANFKIGGLNDDLRATAQQLAGNFRRVQNLATAGQSVSYSGANKVPPGGYGISISPMVYDPLTGNYSGHAKQYTMFADFESSTDDPLNPCLANVPNQLYDITIGGSNRKNCNDQKVEAGVVLLGPNIEVEYINLDTSIYECENRRFNDGHNDPVDTTFKPPFPTPLINGCPGTVHIVLKHLQTGKFRTVYVNAITGQVSERQGGT